MCSNFGRGKPEATRFRGNLWERAPKGFLIPPNRALQMLISPAITMSKKCLSGNEDKKADVLIFPILNNANHGIELYLKSRSEEHTSEIQSRSHHVCRLLLDKKKE